jgi:Amt family ammonium transporter
MALRPRDSWEGGTHLKEASVLSLLAEDPPTIDTGNTAWLLVSSALVLLMTPGLALFYGGLNRAKGVLNMMMMSFVSIGLVAIIWVVYGFTLAFGVNDSAAANDFIGSFTQYLGTPADKQGEIWMLAGASTGIPTYVFMVFQMMFAIITVALISGSLSDRTKFAGWIVFVIGWVTLVYIPVAHWVWGGGFIGAKIHALDFAGGTAVHINAGAAALGVALVLGKRLGFLKETFKPHNVPFVALGAGLLWFGWFGFNAGSELTVDSITGLAFVNTQVATAAGVLGWIIVEWIRNGKPTLVGASSGAIAGLVAITPACGFIGTMPAVLLGIIAGAICALAVGLKYKLGYDDSLDVVGVHFVGGWIGSLFLGFFASVEVNSFIESGLGGQSGLFAGGDATQLGRQALASGIVTVYSFGVAVLLALIIKFTIGLRVQPDAEAEGIDVTEHAESGYDLSLTGGTGTGAFAAAGILSAPSAKAAAEETAPVTEKVAG